MSLPKSYRDLNVGDKVKVNDQFGGGESILFVVEHPTHGKVLSTSRNTYHARYLLDYLGNYRWEICKTTKRNLPAWW